MSGETLASKHSAKKSAKWHSGQVIADKFELIREMGRGGMGAVWEAEHRALGSRVAVKLIEPDAAKSTLGVVRFVREAKASAALRSPHVVQTLDHGVDEGAPYIVMELLEGEPLDRRLDRQGHLSNVELVRVVTHVARALIKARKRQIIHRDLKPANIFIVRNDDEEIVKVLDFGIAKQNVAAESQESGETKSGTLVGTPMYMSPEQARGKPVDWRSDLWSLGVIAYQCHVGQRPFRGSSLGELILQICAEPIPVPSEQATVVDGFDAWFAKAVARDPDDRFQSAKEMATTLRELLLAEGVSDVERPSIISQTGDLPSVDLDTKTDLGSTIRKPRSSSLAPALLAAAAIGAAAYWMSREDPPVTPAADTTATVAPTIAAESASEVRVRITPPTAKVLMSGKTIPIENGELILRGLLGSVHHVTVIDGERRADQDVIITENGASPNAVSLPASSSSATSEPPPAVQPPPPHAAPDAPPPLPTAAQPTAAQPTAAQPPTAQPPTAPPTVKPPPPPAKPPPPPAPKFEEKFE